MNQAMFFQHVLDVLEKLDVTYFVVGSMASSAYGEVRYTHDIDIVVKLIPEDIPALIRAFPEPDHYVSEEAARDAIREGGQFNVIHVNSGHKADFMICGSDLWSRHQVARRIAVEVLPGRTAYAASAEDVILGKLLYYREGASEKHTRDISWILRVQKEKIDRAYIEHWAKELNLTQVWQQVLAKVASA